MSTGAPAVVPLPYTPPELEERLGSDWSTILTDGFRWMLLARQLDQRMLALQRQGRIGFYGPATGQEAVSVGAGLASTPDDWVFPGLREQLIALVRGHPLGTYMNHLFANEEDPARGRQMPCHPTAREVHYVSMSSVVGTQISQAVGVAFALKYRKEVGVALAFFGDGATSANDFHAGLNFAGVMGLPLVFCCTNNQWAISVPVEHQTRSATLAEKSTAYGFPGRRIDGTDFIAVYADLKKALADARAGRGPTLLEFVVYRMTPHSSSDDPTRYQGPDWMARALANDPVRRLEGYLMKHGLLDADTRAAMNEAVDGEVKAAIQTAEAVAPPPPGTMTTDVFAALADATAHHR